MSPSLALENQVKRDLEALRSSLVARFGHCGFQARLLPSTIGQLRIEATVVVPQLEGELRRRLQVPSLELTIKLAASGPTRRLSTEPTPLYRQHPVRFAGPTLTTELTFADGPLAPVTDAEGATLVRCRDGTSGWILAPLGELQERLPFQPARGACDDVVQAARRYVGVPYVLGGATSKGLDCSSLVQRAFFEGAHIVLPRHSTDQLAHGGPTEPCAPMPGDLLLLQGSDEGLSHVVLVAGVDPLRAIHASLSRGRVVEEDLSQLLSREVAKRHTGFRDLYQRHQELVSSGATSLPLAGAGGSRTLPRTGLRAR